MHKKLPLLVYFLTTFSISAQQKKIQELPLKDKFSYIYKKSTTYTSPSNKMYKVVNMEHYSLLRKSSLDTINSLKETIKSQENLINSSKNNIIELQTSTKKLENDLQTAINQNNSILFFGLQIEKSNYNLLMGSIIFLLIGALLYFIYQFKNSHIITKKALLDLSELDEEYQEHRKTALKREQKVRRELQDLINKQKSAV